jgi:hypothetical protein
METRQETYRSYLQSTHWKRTRAKKRKRAQQCGICGATKNLDVHHLNYRQLTDVTMSDLRVLCRRCHEVAHVLHKVGAYTFTSTNHHHRWAVLKRAVQVHIAMTAIKDEAIDARRGRSPVVDRAWIMAHKTPGGGWTKAQLRSLGVSWPPPKGWLSRIVGQPMTKDIEAAFHVGAHQ